MFVYQTSCEASCMTLAVWTASCDTTSAGSGNHWTTIFSFLFFPFARKKFHSKISTLLAVFSSPASCWENKREKKKTLLSPQSAGLLKLPFNKGSLTRLVAIVQSRSMFPWRQLILCIHRLGGLRSRGSERALAQRGQPGFFPDKSNFFGCQSN